MAVASCHILWRRSWPPLARLPRAELASLPVRSNSIRFAIRWLRSAHFTLAESLAARPRRGLLPRAMDLFPFSAAKPWRVRAQEAKHTPRTGSRLTRLMVHAGGSIALPEPAPREPRETSRCCGVTGSREARGLIGIYYQDRANPRLHGLRLNI